MGAQRGTSNFVLFLHVMATILTSGAWLIFLLVRYLYRNTKR